MIVVPSERRSSGRLPAAAQHPSHGLIVDLRVDVVRC